MSRTPGRTLRRWVALLLLSVAVGLTLAAPAHARHDTGADPSHQRNCVVVAWSKAMQCAAVTPTATLALDAAWCTEPAAQRHSSSPELPRPTPKARAPPPA